MGPLPGWQRLTHPYPSEEGMANLLVQKLLDLGTQFLQGGDRKLVQPLGLG